MSTLLAEPIKSLLKSAAKRLTGTRRRQFMTEVTLELFEGSPQPFKGGHKVLYIHIVALLFNLSAI